MKKIIMVAGGTGGHVFPAIALSEILQKHDYEISFITDERGAKYFNSQHQIIISDLKYNSKYKLSKILLLFRIFVSIFSLVKLLNRLKPSLVIGFGGYQTIGSLLAAGFLNIPIMLYEPNSILGKSNRLFRFIARKIILSSVIKSDSTKFELIGPLVRQNIKQITRQQKKSANNFKIFIFGGSQGAKIFSQIMPAAIEQLLSNLPKNIRLNIVQQVDIASKQSIKELYDRLKITYELAEFFPNISDIYSDSDLVIARSGASTINELLYIGLPAILIPYPHAVDNHQFYNAKNIEEINGAICISQKDLTVELVAEKLLYLISHSELLKEMSQNLLKTKNNYTQSVVATVAKIIK